MDFNYFCSQQFNQIYEKSIVQKKTDDAQFRACHLSLCGDNIDKLR